MHAEECLKLSIPPRSDVSLNHPPLFSIYDNFSGSPLHSQQHTQNSHTMAKFYALFLPLCFLLLSSCLAQSEQNECLQLNRLKALQPDHRIKSEAGTIETWNPNNNQLRCAGVGITRCTIQPNGLRMPSYSNTPQLIYIQRGQKSLLIPLSHKTELYIVSIKAST